MSDIDRIRTDIEFMRTQAARQRRNIFELRKAGIPTGPADELLQRMFVGIDRLCAQWGEMKRLLPRSKSRVLGGRTWQASPAGYRGGRAKLDQVWTSLRVRVANMAKQATAGLIPQWIERRGNHDLQGDSNRCA
jgi:hypothetical protein